MFYIVQEIKMTKTFFKTSFLAVFILASSTIYSQDKPKEQKLPPINELPKKGENKTFYEFENVYEFELFDSKGKLIQKGNAQFVDTSKIPNGTYFFLYNGKKVLYKKGK